MYNGTLGSQAHRPYVVQELVGYQTPGQANYSIKKITSFATLEKGKITIPRRLGYVDKAEEGKHIGIRRPKSTMRMTM